MNELLKERHTLYRNTSIVGVVFQGKEDRLERRPQFIPNHLGSVLINHSTLDHPSLDRLKHMNQQQPELYRHVSSVDVCCAHILAAQAQLHVMAERELEAADEERELGEEDLGDHDRLGLECGGKQEIPRSNGWASPGRALTKELENEPKASRGWRTSACKLETILISDIRSLSASKAINFATVSAAM